MAEALPDNWGANFKTLVLHTAIFGTLLRDVPGVFSAEWFGEVEGVQLHAPQVRIAKVVEDFYKQEGVCPGPIVVEELLRSQSRFMSAAEYQTLQAEFGKLADVKMEAHEWVVKRVRKWVRLQAYAKAIYSMAGVIDKADKDENVEFDTQCEAMLEKARLVGAPEDQAIPLIATARDRIADWVANEDATRKIPTGLEMLDLALGGGVEKGEMFYFLAPPKGGKSTFLLNMAFAASRRRKKVLFCSFEMPRKAMTRRADRRLALASPEQLHEDPYRLLRAVAGYRASGAGEIYMWAGVASKNGVRDAEAAFLSLKKQGIDIELVVMDYLNFMIPAKMNENEMRHRLFAVSLEMSAFVRKYDVAGWSATLVNRAAVSKKIITKADIAEAFSVIAVANGVVAICAPKLLVANRLRSLYLAAVRESEDEKMVGLYRFNGEKMLVANTDEEWPEEDEEDTEGKKEG